MKVITREGEEEVKGFYYPKIPYEASPVEVTTGHYSIIFKYKEFWGEIKQIVVEEIGTTSMMVIFAGSKKVMSIKSGNTVEIIPMSVWMKVYVKKKELILEVGS